MYYTATVWYKTEQQFLVRASIHGKLRVQSQPNFNRHDGKTTSICLFLRWKLVLFYVDRTSSIIVIVLSVKQNRIEFAGTKEQGNPTPTR
jgi:hypothetical protein